MQSKNERETSFGQKGTSFVDRFGVYLSHRAITHHLPHYKLKLLDVGCGYNATLLMDLQPRLELGVGIDYKIAENLKSKPGYLFYEKTFESVVSSLEPNYFDVITMISVIEHVWDPISFLKWGFELLKPGGKLIINVPSWRGKIFLEFSAFKLKTSPALEMDDHKMYYNIENLWPLLIQAGFKPSKVLLNYHKFGLNLFSVSCK